MATELDKLVVKIEADLSSLKKQMQQSTKIVDQSSGRIKKSLNGMNKSFQKLGKNTLKFGAIFGTAFGGLAIRSVLKSGIAVEELALRFNLFFGSVEEGSKAFDVLLDFAKRVPFSLGQIQQGAGSLLSISNNAQELSRNLNIVGNLAAATGLEFRVAAEQYGRVASAGANAADLLRERGVLAQLGFISGVKVTAQESVKIFEEAFGKGGKFAGATDDMANTLRGIFSQVTDSLEKFEQAIASTFIPRLTEHFGDLVTSLRANEAEIEEIGKAIGEDLADALNFIIENKDAVVFALKAIGFAALVSAANFATFGVSALLLSKVLTFIATLPKKLGKKILGLGAPITAELAALNAELSTLSKTIELAQKENQSNKSIVPVDKESLDSLKQLSAEIVKFKEGLVDIFDDAGKSISDVIGKAIASGQSFKQSMLDIFQNVIAQVLSLIIQLTIVDQILKDIKDTIEGSKSNTFLGVLTDVGKSIFAPHLAPNPPLTNTDMIMGGLTPLAMPLGGPRQTGGSMNANMPFLVGERGAEVVVPRVPSSIQPLGRSMSSGQSINIEQNLNFATGVSATVRAEVLNLLPAIQETTVSAVQNARLRGGKFAKDFGG
tara:strand:+ start:350 stop:2170 length:1821 start_codon:yes stop_codon:yes gene_type:complete